jgi:hypothetical protein
MSLRSSGLLSFCAGEEMTPRDALALLAARAAAGAMRAFLARLTDACLQIGRRGMATVIPKICGYTCGQKPPHGFNVPSLLQPLGGAQLLHNMTPLV